MANSRFSLNDYFTHIGLHGYHPDTTLECLQEISFRHLITFPYENSRLYQEGKKPEQKRQIASLNPDILFNEMVNKKMPAYCYQNNGLLHAVLARIGFHVSRHFSKVILKPRDEIDTAALAALTVTHLTLTVQINNDHYIVDTGFSNESLRQPLLLTSGSHKLGDEDYMLEEFSNHWLLHSSRYTRDNKQYWFGLFRFDKKPVNDIEINEAHHDLYHAKDIPIRTDLLLYSRVSDHKRKFVCWHANENHGLFRSTNKDGSIRDTKEFNTEADAVAFAKKKFSL